MGNTRYYTKDNGQSFAELEYDVWGAVTSPSKLNNNDNGNFAAAVFTGHPYDTVLDIYFAEARFYDAKHRQWMSVDPIKSGLNWYLYVEGNPATFFDPNGMMSITPGEINMLKEKYRRREIDEETLVKVVVAREALGSTHKGITTLINNAKLGGDIKKFLYLSDVVNLTKNMLYNSFHTITQILAAAKLEERYNLNTILEKPVFDFANSQERIDIFDKQTSHIYEVKPIYTDIEEWEGQINKYVQHGKKEQKHYIPGNEKIEGIQQIFSFLNGTNAYLVYLNLGEGKIGYFFILACGPEEDEIAQNAKTAGWIAWELNKFLKKAHSVDEIADQLSSQYTIWWNTRNTMERGLELASRFWQGLAKEAIMINVRAAVSVAFNEALEDALGILLKSNDYRDYTKQANKLIKTFQDNAYFSSDDAGKLAKLLKETVDNIKQFPIYNFDMVA